MVENNMGEGLGGGANAVRDNTIKSAPENTGEVLINDIFAFLQNPAQAVINRLQRNDAADQGVEQLGAKLQFKKIQVPVEITVSGIPGHSQDLPGGAQYRINKVTGAQELTVRSQKNGEIEEELSISTDANGKLKITYKPDNCQLKVEEGKQFTTITTPSGTRVMVDQATGRIVETAVRGQVAELLTKEQAEERAESRFLMAAKPESWKMARAINEGKINADDVRRLFQMAKIGLFGENGEARLVKLLNEMLHNLGSKYEVSMRKNQVVINNRETGDRHIINTRIKNEKPADAPQKQIERPDLPVNEAQGIRLLLQERTDIRRPNQLEQGSLTGQEINNIRQRLLNSRDRNGVPVYPELDRQAKGPLTEQELNIIRQLLRNMGPQPKLGVAID